MVHKSELVSVSVSWKDVEKAFVEVNVGDPIIQFMGYDERTKEDKYMDQKSGKVVKVSTEKKIMPCPICEKRVDEYNALAREVQKMKPANVAQEREYWERKKDDYKKHLKECEGCRGVVGSSISDVYGTAHTHVCEDCNLNYPRERGFVYSGPYEDDSLVKRA